jgi:hypothetical protein
MQGRNFGLYIMAFVFLILFLLPVLFTRVQDEISWTHVLKIWKDQALLFVVYGLNHWLIAPKLMLRKKYGLYPICIAAVVALSSFSYYYYDNVLTQHKEKVENADPNKPTPIPPYAHLLMYSLLIVGVDSGLLFSKKWYENEENKRILEVKNAEMQLDMLKNQVSPHFFMNTLNNIYALIDCDTPRAKAAVMKLSKLMRYMLYESEHGRVKISKEFEFIQSHIDLMKLRYADDVAIRLIFPEELGNLEIPPMLFICYIENAFKHGVSYQQDSFINVTFEKRDDKLHFSATNSRTPEATKHPVGGLGLKNNENRLKLLYGDQYSLAINSFDQSFNVTLEIPLT